jgi:UrcA family protein
MSNFISRRFAPRLAVTAVALMAGTMGMAQQVGSMPQVSVQAQREVTITRGERVGTSSKHMGERVTLTRQVAVSDLDLTTRSDAAELQARIGGAARDACQQLKALFPDGATDIPGYEHTNENCVRDAIASANERLAAVAVEDGERNGVVN